MKMARNRRPRTNVEFVAELMEYSRHGALAQLFVLDALDKWSKIISETDPAKLDNVLVNGEAWKSVAKEINDKIAARYQGGR